jgi:hypothetical protein
MFAMGFDREIFSVRHPSMGVSFGDLESMWKNIYPQVKADLKPLVNATIPGSAAGGQTPVSPTNRTTGPSIPVSGPSGTGGGSSMLLWVGGLAALGLGGYWLWARQQKSSRKK